MQQHGESLRWLEREYQSDVELPFALNSEKKFIAETLFSIEDLLDIYLLIIYSCAQDYSSKKNIAGQSTIFSCCIYL